MYKPLEINNFIVGHKLSDKFHLSREVPMGGVIPKALAI